MKVTASDHMRLESCAKSVLNKLKHCKRISDFKIENISVGEIKVTMDLPRKTVTLQLRSTYGQRDVETAIQSKIPPQTSERSQEQGVELVVAQA